MAPIRSKALCAGQPRRGRFVHTPICPSDYSQRKPHTDYPSQQRGGSDIWGLLTDSLHSNKSARIYEDLEKLVPG